MSIGYPWINAWNKLIGDGLATADAVLYQSAVPSSARTAWAPVPDGLRSIREELQTLISVASRWSLDRDLTPQARTRKLKELQAAARTKIAPAAAAVAAAVQRTVEILRDASSPQRPEPHDAAQETAILGVKADLQMVLAPPGTGSDLTKRLRSLLERALRDGDNLRAWVLCTSWVEDYLMSRDAEEFIPAWSVYVGDILSKSAPAGRIGELRGAYDELTNPQTGAAGIVLAMNTLADRVLNEAIDAAVRAEGHAVVLNPSLS
ncbi:hypothetical protein CWIS_04935 [Cellulomonas sp. A375-1]|uniref:hypothetical protein n=1 Tax=Cellulomonas sp. A375-1 TaxID=1672219 RepID=UPI0006526E6F|nr:hypothetical protein [Cellulomonas sp. A375-1]KMM46486.1 hypothetical protein CWIS_04935 [Cellulomonas sp. A375-1]